MNTYHVYTVCMNPTLNRSSALQRVKLSDALEIRNGIIFDFYSGLPHMIQVQYALLWYKVSTLHHLKDRLSNIKLTVFAMRIMVMLLICLLFLNSLLYR